MTDAIADSGDAVVIDAAVAAEIAAEAEETAVAGADERLAYRGVFQRLLIRPEVGAIIGAVAIWAFFWSVADTFGVATGFASILDVSATLGIMAVAVSLLMIGGEFDLSSGAATGALGIVTILLVKDIGELGGAGLSLHVAIPLSLVVALGLGFFNGVMVEKTGLPSFIVTLATFFILRGFKLGFSKLIIDNISVGRIDEASADEALDKGSRGYEFWQPVFDYVWGRNNHQFLADRPLEEDIATLREVRRLPDGLVDDSGAFVAMDSPLLRYQLLLGIGVVLLLGAIALVASKSKALSRSLAIDLGILGGILAFVGGGLAYLNRDAVYTIGVVAGIILIVVAVFEMNFQRNDKANPLGLIVMAAGIAGAVGSVLYMHSSDGRSANVLACVLIAVSAIAGFGGLSLWRYKTQSPGSQLFTNDTVTWAVGGVVALNLGILLAGWLGLESQESVLDLVGGLRWPLVLVGAAAAGYQVFNTQGANLAGDPFRVGGSIAAMALAGGFAVYAFMFMTTEQGLRAILFGLLVLAGFLALAIAAYKAGRVAPIARGLVLVVSSLMGLRLAWFVQGASRSEKFRSEAFSVILIGALLLLVWAICSTFFTTRTSEDAEASRSAGVLARVGLAGIGVGMIAKLLFTTREELLAEVSPANFRMSVMWFIGITIFATWLLGSTKFGSWIFAVGGNKQAARQIGVPAARTKTQLFMIVSVAAWLVGLLLAFRLNTLQSGTGNGLEFEYIIAAVVGGTLLTGGYGSAFGAAIGALIMAMSKQGIPAARWNSDWRFAFLGIILLSAVIANNFIKNKAEAAGR